MFEKILVCLDGSSLAEQIIPYATEEATHFKSKLILLRVFEFSSGYPTGHGDSEWEAGMPPSHAHTPTPPTSRIKEEDEAKEYLESVAQPLRKKGLEVECITVQAGHEKVGEPIVRYAHNHDMGLIALATHGASGFRRMMFGSIADYVLKNSELPLLVVKPKEK
ncbi:MAG: universal stress protein [Dehalococcoidia bacterium]